MEVAVGLEASHVAGVVPAVAEGVRGHVRLAEVALEDEGPAHHDLARGAGRDLTIVVVHDCHLRRGHRAAGGARLVGHALDGHEAARLGLAEAGPEPGAGLLVQALDGLGRVEAGDVGEARQRAARLLGRVQQARQHRGKVGDVGHLVAVDQAHRLRGVEARHHHHRRAGVEVGQGHAERGHVEEREHRQVAVARGEAEGRDRGQVRREHVGVGEDRAAGDHVHRRGRDHREGVVRRHRGGRRRAAAVEGGQRGEAGLRRAQRVPVRHPLALEPARDQRQGGLVHHHHRGASALHHPLHLRPGEPPVDRVRDDALPRAGAVEVDVGRVVLGQHADPLAARDAEAGEAGGERVHPLAQLPEGHGPVALDHRGLVGLPRGPASDQVVDREGVDAQLSHRLRRL